MRGGGAGNGGACAAWRESRRRRASVASVGLLAQLTETRSRGIGKSRSTNNTLERSQRSIRIRIKEIGGSMHALSLLPPAFCLRQDTDRAEVIQGLTAAGPENGPSGRTNGQTDGRSSELAATPAQERDRETAGPIPQANPPRHLASWLVQPNKP